MRASIWHAAMFIIKKNILAFLKCAFSWCVAGRIGRRKKREHITKELYNQNIKHVRLLQVLEKIEQEREIRSEECKF